MTDNEIVELIYQLLPLFPGDASIGETSTEGNAGEYYHLTGEVIVSPMPDKHEMLYVTLHEWAHAELALLRAPEPFPSFIVRSFPQFIQDECEADTIAVTLYEQHFGFSYATLKGFETRHDDTLLEPEQMSPQGYAALAEIEYKLIENSITAPQAA